jgi:hypothetical protein
MTLGGKLRALAAGVPGVLVSPAAMRDMEAACAGLPAAVTRWLILEVPLDREGARADLSFAVVPGEDLGREVLAGEDVGAAALSPQLAALPAWQRVRAFCQRWAEPGSFLWEEVRSLWCELDTAGDPSAREPSVFVGGAWTRRPGGRPVGVGLFRQALTELLGAEAWGAMRPCLVRTLEALPPGDYTVQAGAMLARGERPMRLCLMGLPAGEVLPWLGRIGWEGSEACARQALGVLGGGVPSFVVQLDVGAALGPYLGLEVYAEDQGLRWPDVLEDLTARGLSRPERAEACLAMRWAAPLSLDDGLHPFSHVARTLSHVKLACPPGAERPATKAYLSLVQR